MRIEYNEQGYVQCILYGCYTGHCCEYTGLVPAEPEEYADIDDWADRAQTQAYYLDEHGNLAYDPIRAALYCDENKITPYSDEYLEAIGVKSLIDRTIQNAIYDAIYPVGSIYISANSVSPQTLFGGTWEQIEDAFLLSAGSTYSAGSVGGAAEHSHIAPIGYNTSNKLFGVSYAGGSNAVKLNGALVTTGDEVITDSGSYTWTLPSTSKDSNMPPYLVVFVWERIA